MRRLALLQILFGAIALLLAAGAEAQQPKDLADIARTLPSLPREAGLVRMPLDGAGPFTWRPVRDGIAVTPQAGALTASYRISSGQPAGAALVLPAGTFAGLKSLRLKTHGSRSTQLVIALHDAAGVVYAFPAVFVRVGDSRDAEVFVEDLSYLGPASTAPDPGRFDPSGAVMVTLLDLAGFMSPDTSEVAWTVESLEGVLQ